MHIASTHAYPLSPTPTPTPVHTIAYNSARNGVEGHLLTNIVKLTYSALHRFCNVHHSSIVSAPVSLLFAALLDP